ncbi:GTP-binding protein [Candidatus Woesearchaeota archaeon]|nr:GTP-binding protein [Candidatus Woesearchaeota archaeon]
MGEKTDQRIKELEEEIKNTKYNKATQHHIGLLKAKIAKLKQKKEQQQSSSGGGEGYSVKKAGDGTVVMVGFPSVGKSTLLNSLTNAESKTAPYAFTTLDVIPGMMEYNQAKIQILDVPGIVSGASDGTGRGKEVLSVIWGTDLVMIILDINNLGQYEVVKKEVYNFNIRLNQKKPDVRIRKKAKGGIRIGSTVKLDMNERTIKNILNEFKIINAEVLIRTEINEDQLIDVVEGNKKYVPGFVVINKIDSTTPGMLSAAEKKFPDAVFISAEKNKNLDYLRQKIFDSMDFIRIYLKEPGKEPDMDEPMILKSDSTLKELCEKIHQDFVERFKFARIWGKSVKYDGQMRTKLDQVLHDKDIVELHIS